MLIAVAAFFGYFKNLHIGADNHIISRFHTPLSEKRYKILLLDLFDKRAQIIRADRKHIADACKRQSFIAVLTVDYLNNFIAKHFRIALLRIFNYRFLHFPYNNHLFFCCNLISDRFSTFSVQ